MIEYMDGDASDPIRLFNVIICHVANNMGALHQVSC